MEGIVEGDDNPCGNSFDIRADVNRDRDCFALIFTCGVCWFGLSLQVQRVLVAPRWSRPLWQQNHCFVAEGLRLGFTAAGGRMKSTISRDVPLTGLIPLCCDLDRFSSGPAGEAAKHLLLLCSVDFVMFW